MTIFAKRKNLTGLLFCYLIICACSQPTSETKYADCPPPYDPFSKECLFGDGQSSYSVNAYGKGVRKNGNQLQEFQLDVGKDEYIEGIHYSFYDKDIILVYGVTDGDYGAGEVIRFDGITLKKNWILHIPGFNLSEGLIVKNSLYQAAIGFVSKIDLSTGQFAWKHENLYDKVNSSFNNFALPYESRGKIYFREVLNSNMKYKQPRIIVVNDKSGSLTYE